MKIVKLLNKLRVFLLASSLAMPAFSANTLLTPDPLGQQLYDNYRWSLMYYFGQTVNGALVGTAVGNFKYWPEHIQSLELAYTLDQDNFLRRLVRPLVGVVELAGNTTIRRGDHEPTILELDPYLIFRWANWPWNHQVVTSLALGEGVSYVSSVPYLERRRYDNVRRLLNYLMFEATFANPKYPQLQFLVRIHHRSGAYGLYHAGNNGSNDIGAGIRYVF